MPAKLIADRQPLEPPPILSLVKDEVVAPDFVELLRPPPLGALLARGDNTAPPPIGRWSELVWRRGSKGNPLVTKSFPVYQGNVNPADFDLTLRIGCHITYQTVAPTPVVFMLRPRSDVNHQLLSDAHSFEPGLLCLEFTDAYGNTACRTTLQSGRNDVRLDALVAVSSQPELRGEGFAPQPVGELPTEVLRYTLPSRYCDSDKLLNFAWEHFGRYPHGFERVQAICQWLHDNIEYRYGSGRPDISASEIIGRRYGVCRDFAHTLIALCRTFNVPARYVSGHLPEVGGLVSSAPEDFHAWCEVFLGDRWFTFDARFNVPRIGRVKLSHGLDAVDGAFATIYGAAELLHFEVWTYQVDPDATALTQPVDLTRRWDGTPRVRIS